MNYDKVAPEVLKQFRKWVLNDLSLPKKELGNLPSCPYAKHAWLNNKISLRQLNSNNLEDNLIEQCEDFLLDTQKDVFVLFYPCIKITIDNLELLINKMRHKYFSSNLWLMFDHTSEEEKVLTSNFSFNHQTLIFLQFYSDLIDKSDELKHTDYYNNWSDEYYKLVVKNRENFKPNE